MVVVILDQLSKWWILANFSMHESQEIISGFFHLTYLTNTGAAFGIMAGYPSIWRQLFFVTVVTLALVAIYFLHKKVAVESRWYTVSLSLISGGAVGNLIDRIRHGAVVDYFDFFIGERHWPAFNVADAAITTGVLIFLLLNFLEFMETKKS
jgi:signal peptidase II